MNNRINEIRAEVQEFSNGVSELSTWFESGPAKRMTRIDSLIAQAEHAQHQMADRLGFKPTECPYCHSSNITAHAGHWECECGAEGSY